jgi:hypothetical protein
MSHEVSTSNTEAGKLPSYIDGKDIGLGSNVANSCRVQFGANKIKYNDRAKAFPTIEYPTGLLANNASTDPSGYMIDESTTMDYNPQSEKDSIFAKQLEEFVWITSPEVKSLVISDFMWSYMGKNYFFTEAIGSPYTCDYDKNKIAKWSDDTEKHIKVNNADLSVRPLYFKDNQNVITNDAETGDLIMTEDTEPTFPNRLQKGNTYKFQFSAGNYTYFLAQNDKGKAIVTTDSKNALVVTPDNFKSLIGTGLFSDVKFTDGVPLNKEQLLNSTTNGFLSTIYKTGLTYSEGGYAPPGQSIKLLGKISTNNKAANVIQQISIRLSVVDGKLVAIKGGTKSELEQTFSAVESAPICRASYSMYRMYNKNTTQYSAVDPGGIVFEDNFLTSTDEGNKIKRIIDKKCTEINPSVLTCFPNRTNWSRNTVTVNSYDEGVEITGVDEDFYTIKAQCTTFPAQPSERFSRKEKAFTWYDPAFPDRENPPPPPPEQTNIETTVSEEQSTTEPTLPEHSPVSQSEEIPIQKNNSKNQDSKISKTQQVEKTAVEETEEVEKGKETGLNYVFIAGISVISIILIALAVYFLTRKKSTGSNPRARVNNFNS